MHEDWYHGLMPRDEIEEMLKRDGDFLVRKTEVARKTRFAISVFFNGRIRHLLVNCSHGMWAIRNVSECVYLSSPLLYQPQSKKTAALLSCNSAVILRNVVLSFRCTALMMPVCIGPFRFLGCVKRQSYRENSSSTLLLATL